MNFTETAVLAFQNNIIS